MYINALLKENSQLDIYFIGEKMSFIWETVSRLRDYPSFEGLCPNLLYLYIDLWIMKAYMACTR